MLSTLHGAVFVWIIKHGMKAFKLNLSWHLVITIFLPSLNFFDFVCYLPAIEICDRLNIKSDFSNFAVLPQSILNRLVLKT